MKDWNYIGWSFDSDTFESAILGTVKREKIMDLNEILKALRKLAHHFTAPEVLEIMVDSPNHVIGELTGPKAMKALEIFNRGRDGSLETMCLMANLGLGCLKSAC